MKRKTLLSILLLGFLLYSNFSFACTDAPEPEQFAYEHVFYSSTLKSFVGVVRKDEEGSKVSRSLCVLSEEMNDAASNNCVNPNIPENLSKLVSSSKDDSYLKNPEFKNILAPLPQGDPQSIRISVTARGDYRESSEGAIFLKIKDPAAELKIADLPRVDFITRQEPLSLLKGPDGSSILIFLIENDGGAIIGEPASCGGHFTTHYAYLLSGSKLESMKENKRGLNSLSAKKPEEAKTHFERSMKLSPGRAQVEFNLACALSQLHKPFTEIRPVLEKLLKSYPAEHDVYLKKVKADADLEPFRKQSEFAGWLGKVEGDLKKTLSPSGCKTVSADYWLSKKNYDRAYQFDPNCDLAKLGWAIHTLNKESAMVEAFGANDVFNSDETVKAVRALVSVHKNKPQEVEKKTQGRWFCDASKFQDAEGTLADMGSLLKKVCGKSK